MIQYLVGELRSHKPRGTVKKKKKIKKEEKKPICSSHRKEGHFHTCHNMDELCGRCAK